MWLTSQSCMHSISYPLCYKLAHISSTSNKINLVHKMNSIRDSTVATIACYIEIIVAHAHCGGRVRIVKVVKREDIVKVENTTLEGNISNF